MVQLRELDERSAHHQDALRSLLTERKQLLAQLQAQFEEDQCRAARDGVQPGPLQEQGTARQSDKRERPQSPGGPPSAKRPALGSPPRARC